MLRSDFVVNVANVINVPLVPIHKILLPPLHIKLGLVKNFIKAIIRDGEAFKCLTKIFPRLSVAKEKVLFLVLFFHCINIT